VFSATLNGTSVTSVSIPGGSSSVNFYYGDTKPAPGHHPLGLAGLGHQTETITARRGQQVRLHHQCGGPERRLDGQPGPITVQEQDTFGNPTTTAETVTWAPTRQERRCSPPPSTAQRDSVSIPGGSSSVNFYYGDTKAGSPVITASGSLASATQTETITAAAANKFVYTTSAVSGAASSTASLGPITSRSRTPSATDHDGRDGHLGSSSTGKVFSATLNGTSVTR